MPDPAPITNADLGQFLRRIPHGRTRSLAEVGRILNMLGTVPKPLTPKQVHLIEQAALTKLRRRLLAAIGEGEEPPRP